MWSKLLFGLGIFALAYVAPTPAQAADLEYSPYHRKHSAPLKKRVRVAGLGCRTGWYMTNCNGLRRPAWGTRCY